MRKKVCVECGNHVPVYLNYLCEDCWCEAWNEKLAQDKLKGMDKDGENRSRY